VYPDADKRGQGELDHVFSTSSTGGKQVISKTVATFKALVEEAEFSGAGQADPHLTAAALHTPIGRRPNGQTTQTQKQSHFTGPALHIDIQIHISPGASAEQIEPIFASMGKHIYGRGTAE
jgi:hypothetical protein